MQKFSVRATPAQMKALEGVKQHTRQSTANKAIWAAVEGYVDTYREKERALADAARCRAALRALLAHDRNARAAERQRIEALALAKQWESDGGDLPRDLMGW